MTVVGVSGEARSLFTTYILTLNVLGRHVLWNALNVYLLHSS